MGIEVILLSVASVVLPWLLERLKNRAKNRQPADPNNAAPAQPGRPLRRLIDRLLGPQPAPQPQPAPALQPLPAQPAPAAPQPAAPVPLPALPGVPGGKIGLEEFLPILSDILNLGDKAREMAKSHSQLEGNMGTLSPVQTPRSDPINPQI